jgi:diguanylate cyclase (GGDEF)-like protein/PAS domain S-box-containing protein
VPIELEPLLLTRRPAPQRHAIAIAIFGAALALRFLILPIDATGPFLTFYPATVLAFLLTGTGPGRVVVALGAAAGFYIFTPPHWSLVPTKAGLLSVAAFIIMGLMIGWVIERLRDTASRLQSTLAHLRVNEQHYRSLIEEQTDLVALSHPDGQLVYVNPAYARYFGRTQDEMVGVNLFEFVDVADREAVAQQIDDVLRSGTSQTGENAMHGADGTDRWVAWTNSVRIDPAGQTLVQSVGRDITERSAAEKALRDLTDIIHNTTDYVVQTDKQGGITYLNPAARRVVGLGPDDPIGPCNFAEFVTPATQHLFADVIVPAIKARGVWVGEATACHADGHEVPVSQLVIAHRDESGRVARCSGVMRDITAEVAARHELQRQTETLRSVAEAIPAGVAVVSADARYRFVNNAFERWCGKPRADILGRTAPEVLGEAEFRRRWPWAQRALAGEAVTFTLDYPGIEGNAYLSLNYVPLHLDSGAVDGFVVVTQDVTGHKREEVRLLELARRDPLTGLLNRAGLEQHLERDVLADGGSSIAVLYIDLDHFKPVNDRHGHPAGDQLLMLFAQRLRKLVRPIDAVARLGGDEFAIVLLGIQEPSRAQLVADKVLAAAHEPFHVGTQMLRIGASVGVAHGVDKSHGWRELIGRADAQLLIAKAAGRGRLMVEGC